MSNKNPNQEICQNCGHEFIDHLVYLMSDKHDRCRYCSCKKFVPEPEKVDFLKDKGLLGNPFQNSKSERVSKNNISDIQSPQDSVNLHVPKGKDVRCNSEPTVDAQSQDVSIKEKLSSRRHHPDTRKGSDDEILKEIEEWRSKGDWVVDSEDILRKAISLTRQAEQKRILELIGDLTEYERNGDVYDGIINVQKLKEALKKEVEKK